MCFSHGREREKNDASSDNDFHAGSSGLGSAMPLRPIEGSTNEPCEKPAEQVDDPRAGNGVDWQTRRKLGGMEPDATRRASLSAPTSGSLGASIYSIWKPDE